MNYLIIYEDARGKTNHLYSSSEDIWEDVKELEQKGNLIISTNLLH